jgi:glucokinase
MQIQKRFHSVIHSVVSHAAAAAVGGNGSTGGDELCEMAFDVFMLAYGSEVGATAL